MKTTVLTGKPLAGGTASGHICLYEENIMDALPKYSLPPGGAGSEKLRLAKGIKKTADELAGIQEEVTLALSETEAGIFHAHAMMLEDSSFLKEIENLISSELINAEWALARTAEDYTRKLEALPADYLRERTGDIKDLVARVVKNLGYSHSGFACRQCEPASSIIAADNLSPSLISGLGTRKAAGIAAEKGSPASHGAILAKALGIPVIIGVDNLIENLGCGTPAIIDADAGRLFLNPDEETARRYAAPHRRAGPRSPRLRDGLAETRDGGKIRIMVNASRLQDVARGLEYGVKDTGLFRTEFLFAGRESKPSAGEQAEIYREVMNLAKGRVTFRLLDAGGDKDIPFITLPRQENPELGLRGVRIYSRYPGIIDEQIDALLAAGGEKPFRITVPMVAVIEEFLAIRDKILAKARGAAGPAPEIGCMIEVPAALVMLEKFVKECDFLSIGTNDLIQYLMGSDRGNDYLGELNNPLQPAVARALKHISGACAERGREAVVCGEMAGSPEAARILVGLGYRNLSMNPGSIPAVVEALAAWTAEEMEARARELLER